MKIALVHDDFIQAGGAESLFSTIASIWPNAPIFTSLVNWNKVPASIDHSRIITSWMQKIPFKLRFYKLLLPFYPLAFESFNFDKYDIVISSTTRFAKSIITKPKTIHIAYVNNIPRFLWNKKIQKSYIPNFAVLLLKPYFRWMNRWDKVVSSRVDFYIANSKHVARNIFKIYQRKSEIVYPFADLDFFKPPKIHQWSLKKQEYYLIVSRLVKWKGIELAINTLARQNVNLKIIGEGPDKKRLVNLAKHTKGNVEFLGRVTIDQLRNLYQNCQALIVTQEEDFGVAAVETQACGIPVIAYKKGGQAEIINNNFTGIFFDEQTEESLKDAIIAASGIKWSVSACRKNSLNFSQAAFIGKLNKQVQLYEKKS